VLSVGFVTQCRTQEVKNGSLKICRVSKRKPGCFPRVRFPHDSSKRKYFVGVSVLLKTRSLNITSFVDPSSWKPEVLHHDIHGKGNKCSGKKTKVRTEKSWRKICIPLCMQLEIMLIRCINVSHVFLIILMNGNWNVELAERRRYFSSVDSQVVLQGEGRGDKTSYIATNFQWCLSDSCYWNENDTHVSNR